MSKWRAPEIIESKAGDVYSFGMVVWMIFAISIPCEREKAVLFKVPIGGRPRKPESAREVGFTDDMWSLVERCWDQNPEKRPTMREVVREWREFMPK
jgi:serine/threonine protein kinase